MAIRPHDERDRILGAFLNVWSGLEIALINVLWTLLETDFHAARAVYLNASGPQQVRDLLLALATLRLLPEERKKLKQLCDRIKASGTKRNRIVHASWHAITKLNDEKSGIDVIGWERRSLPADAAVEEALRDPVKNQKEAANHQFSLAKIVAVSRDILHLTEDVHELNEAVKARVVPEGLPILSPHSKPRAWTEPRHSPTPKPSRAKRRPRPRPSEE